MATARARGAHVPFFSRRLAAAPVQSRNCALGKCGRRGALDGAAALPEMLRTPQCAGAALGEFAMAPIGRGHPMGRDRGIAFVRLPFRGAPPAPDFADRAKFEISTNLESRPSAFSTNQLRNVRQCTVLRAIVAAALSLLPGSSAPAALRGRALERGGTAFGLAVSCAGRRMGSTDRAPARRSPKCFFRGTIALGLQASASSSRRRFQTRSL